MTQHSLNVHFCSACGHGDFEAVQYLLYSTELSKHVPLDYAKNKGLSFACRKGHLNIVKYLLVDHNNPEFDIHADQDSLLYSAVSEGQLEVTKYLLKSPELKENANLKDNEYIIKSAFVAGHLNMIQYFFNDLKDEINIDNDTVFRIAYNKSYHDILEYLIFGAKIEMSPSIKGYLEYRGDSFANKIESMFNKREEAAILEKELGKNTELNKKPFKL